jgi:hypothetical protein
MSLYFKTRIINLGPVVPDVHDNTILYVADELTGTYLRSMLEDEYGQLMFESEGGTAGNVADPLNVEHGEPLTVHGSIREHQKLASFLLIKITGEEFMDVPRHQQLLTRQLYRLVKDALHMQEALSRVGANIVVTVCWS